MLADGQTTAVAQRHSAAQRSLCPAIRMANDDATWVTAAHAWRCVPPVRSALCTSLSLPPSVYCAPLLQSFLLSVRVGSQQFALQLDMTSSVLAVAMRDCAGCHYVAPLYAPAGSTTAVPTGVAAAQRYPDGSEWRGL